METAARGVLMLLMAKRYVETSLYAVIAVLLMGLAVVIGLQVFNRYVLNASLAWSEEASRLLLVWMTFLGGGLASFRGAHLRLALLAERLGRNSALVVNALVVAATLLFLGVLFVGNIEVIEVREGMPFTSFPLSSKYLSYAISTGAVLMAVGTIVSFVVSVLESFKKDSA